VPEAARLFFGKDVSNLTLAEAATIAGVFQSPSRCRRSTTRSVQGRRNVVLQSMVDAGYVTRMPPTVRSRAAHRRPALEAEAPYFVDFVGQTLAGNAPASPPRRPRRWTSHAGLPCNAWPRMRCAAADPVDSLLRRASAAAEAR
jgi:membrane peptidoglycan carboxypeptidase